jgi:histone deacetylase 6
VKKICIFDWDIHVGDGTSEIFYEDDSILYISLHRYDQGYFYPGKGGSPALLGKDKGFGYNIQFGFDTQGIKDDDNVTDKDYIYACHSFSQ